MLEGILKPRWLGLLTVLFLCAVQLPAHGYPLTQNCGSPTAIPTFDNESGTVTFTGPQSFAGSFCLFGPSTLPQNSTVFSDSLTVDDSLWVQNVITHLTGTHNSVANSVPSGLLDVNSNGVLFLSNPDTVLQGNVKNTGTFGGLGTVNGNVTNDGVLTTSNNLLPGTTTHGNPSWAGGSNYSLPGWMSKGQVAATSTFTITGNLDAVNSANSTLLFQEGPTEATKLSIGQQYDPAGNILIVNFNQSESSKGPLRPTYTLISAPNATYDPSAVSTNLIRLEVANASPDWTYVLTYAPNGNVYLTVDPLRAFQSQSIDKNTLAIAKVLDSRVAAADGALYDALNTLYQLPKGSLNTALRQLDGELNAELPQIIAGSVSDSWNPVYARMGMSASLGGYRIDDGGHLWMSGLGDFGGVEGNAAASGYSQHSAGTLIGADTKIADLFNVGLTTGYLSLGADRTGMDNSLGGNLWQIGTYADMPFGEAGHFGLLFGYDQGGINTQNLSLLGLAKGSQNVRLITAEAIGSWRNDLGGGHSLTPIVAIESITMQHTASTETGLAALGVSQGSYSGDFVSGRIQARYDYDWEAFDVRWTASLAAGLREMLNQPLANSTITLTGTQGGSFQVRGAQGNGQTGAGLVNAGLKGHLNDQFDVEIGYRGLYTGTSQLSSFQGNLSWRYDAPKTPMERDRVGSNPTVENPKALGDKKDPLTIRDPGADMANYPNSAFTLPQGGFYLESTPFSYSAKSPLTGAVTYSAPTLLRYGLVDNLELRLFYTPYEVQTNREGTVAGSGNLAFDTKIHLWDEWSSYFIPAAGFEVTVQTPWLASTAFQSRTSPAFTFNFDQQMPFDIGIEYNLGASDLQDPRDLSKNVWNFMAQWAAQRDITDDIALFFNGYYNSTLLPRVSQKVSETKVETRYKTVCHSYGSRNHQTCTQQQTHVLVPYNVLVPLEPINSVPVVLGGGLIWTLNDHVQLFGNAAAGVTQSSPSLQAYVGFAWTP